MAKKSFVHLHVHTENSMLDGHGRVKPYVTKAAVLGMPALAMTDHGNLIGAPEFYKECRKQGVEPIIGCEFYFVEDIATAREDKDANRSHMTFLARGAKGYRVLSRLNTESWQNYYYKPLIDRAMLERLGSDAQHLTVLSGCAGSKLSRHLQAEEDDEAREEVLWWRETFPHYYIELMHHDTDFDVRLNEALLDLSSRYNIPYVITNDPHYVEPEHAKFHDILLAIQMAKDIDDPERMRFDGSGYWLKSMKEMKRAFQGYDPEVWETGRRNTIRIAKESRTRIKAWESKAWQIPKYPDVEDADEYLRKLTFRGLKKLGKDKDPVYRKMAKQELAIMKETGIADFMLITWDIIDWARKQGIRVGPGRGSVCGSLVAWAIRIHLMDPIKHKLLFERFLNPARPKLPDVDSDFMLSRRSEVFDYAINKYGEENTMMVAAIGKMQVTAAFNSISKTFGVNYLEAQRLNKEIIDETDEETGEHTYHLPSVITERYPELAEALHSLAGIKRQISKHPAGLIIADPTAKLHSQVPEMYIPSSKTYVAAFDKKALESMGFLKEDFLSLRSLDTVQVCIDLIKKRRGIEIDPDSWVPDEEEDDDKVYEMLASGRTGGVFQMEGPANQRGCRDVVPTSFEDLVSITSLYRTGAISAGFPRIFIANRKKGKKGIEYAHKKLKPILRPTWGVVLYQEQVMDFGRYLAGFDMVLVDDIKEAIKDKSSDDMKAIKPKFIKGCKVHSGIDNETAHRIWKMIEGYAGYGYNRSHAVAYTFLTYQTARLKYLYPIEYTAALMRTVEAKKDNVEKREGYLREFIALGGKVLPPDVNESEEGMTPTPLPQNDLRFGLKDFAGIGDKHAVKLVIGRPEGGYTDIEQVETAANNTGVMKVLQEGSALVSLGIPGSDDRTEELLRWQFRDSMADYRRVYRAQTILPTDQKDDVSILGEIVKITHGKTKKLDPDTNRPNPYVTWKLRHSPTESYDVRLWKGSDEGRKKLWELAEGSVVMVMGEWDPKWLNVACGNPRMIKVINPVRQKVTK